MASDLSSAAKLLIDNKKIPAFGAIILDKHGNKLYDQAFGTVNVNDEDAPAFTNDTDLMLFSCTKLITSICALQLIEQGKLSLDYNASKYFPKVKDIKIATEMGTDGNPIISEPEKEIKIIHLITHTSGLTYDLSVSTMLICTSKEANSNPVSAAKTSCTTIDCSKTKHQHQLLTLLKNGNISTFS